MTASTESLCFVRCDMGSSNGLTNSQADSANDRAQGHHPFPQRCSKRDTQRDEDKRLPTHNRQDSMVESKTSPRTCQHGRINKWACEHFIKWIAMSTLATQPVI